MSALKSNRKLPKPIDTQDYLRRPLKEVETLISLLKKKKSIQNISRIPAEIGRIFGFQSIFLIIDNYDDNFISVIENNKCEYITVLKDDQTNLQYDFLATTIGICYSDYEKSQIEVEMKNGEKEYIRAENCGGCPNYISIFDWIIQEGTNIYKMKDEKNKERKIAKVTDAITDLFNFIMVGDKYSIKSFTI